MAGSGDIRAGGAYVELYGKKDQLGKDLKDSKSSIKQWASDITSLGAGFTALGAAIAAPLALAAKSFVEQGSLLDDISQRTGISADALGGLKYAADLTGTSIEDLTSGLRKMALTVDGARNGQQSAVDTLKRLGITVSDLKNKKPEEMLALFADKVSLIPDLISRATIANELFGKAGEKLIPMLSLGSAGMAQLRQEAESLGLIMSTEDVKAAAEFGDALDRTWAAVRGFSVTVGSALAPALQAGADLFVAISKPVRDFLKDNKELVIAAALTGVGLLAIGAALTGLGLTMTLIATAGTRLASLAGVLSALALNPVTWLTAAAAAVVGVIGYVTGAFDSMESLFGSAFDGATQAIQGIANAIRSGNIEAAWAIVRLNLQIGWLQTTNALSNYWLDFCFGIESAFIDAGTSILKQLLLLNLRFKEQFLGETLHPNVQAAMLRGVDIAGGLIKGTREGSYEQTKGKSALELAINQKALQILLDAVKPPEIPTVIKDLPDISHDSMNQSGSAFSDSKSDNIVSATASRAALGISGNATSRMVKAAEETAKNTKKIADNPGLLFGV